MTKMSRLQLKSKLLFCLLLTFSISNLTFASNVISNSAANIGPRIIKDNRLIVTGDSFAGKFCDFEMGKDLQVVPYARAGQTIDRNKYIMAEALELPDRNVLISIGVNDQFAETPPYQFEYILRSLMNITIANNKIVFLHSYLKYFSDMYKSKRFPAEEYDVVIRRICNEYINAFYIDVKDLENTYYISDDNMHYNALFYDELYRRICNKIYEIES